MMKRTIAIGTALLLSTAGLYAQRGDMSGEAADTIPGMRAHGMMMKGATGHGMMGCPMMGEGMMGEGMMGQGRMGGMMTGHAMMMGAGPSPGMLLQRREALELTDDQVARLEEIRDEASGEMQGHMTVMMSARREAAEALQDETPDLDAYEEALERAASQMVQAHMAMARTADQTRDVLTAEQWEQVREQGMMHGPAMHGPGTEGGPGMMGGSGHEGGGTM